MAVRLHAQRWLCLVGQAIIQVFPCVFISENLYSFARARLDIDRANACSRHPVDNSNPLIACVVRIVWQRRHSGIFEILLYPPATGAKHVARKVHLHPPTVCNGVALQGRRLSPRRLSLLYSIGGSCHSWIFLPWNLPMECIISKGLLSQPHRAVWLVGVSTQQMMRIIRRKHHFQHDQPVGYHIHSAYRFRRGNDM